MGVSNASGDWLPNRLTKDWPGSGSHDPTDPGSPGSGGEPDDPRELQSSLTSIQRIHSLLCNCFHFWTAWRQRCRRFRRAHRDPRAAVGRRHPPRCRPAGAWTHDGRFQHLSMTKTDIIKITNSHFYGATAADYYDQDRQLQEKLLMQASNNTTITIHSDRELSQQVTSRAGALKDQRSNEMLVFQR